MKRSLAEIEDATRASEIESFIDAIIVPSFLLLQNCTVIHLNSRAKDAVNRARGLMMSPIGRLLLLQNTEAAHLEKLVFDAANTGKTNGSTPSGFLTFTVSDELSPNSMFVYPMGPLSDGPLPDGKGEGSGQVLVTVHYRQDAHLLSEDRLKSAFGFTSSESQVVLALASGATTSELAQQTDRSVHTIRLHLKHALQKADCRSKLELMSVLFKTICQPI